MAITINTKAYDINKTLAPNSVEYTGPAATFASKDQLALKTTAPKATADFAGVARSEAKLTRSFVIGGKPIDMIVTASFSVPVGISKADVDTMRNDVAAFIDSTNADNLVWKHDLQQ